MLTRVGPCMFMQHLRRYTNPVSVLAMDALPLPPSSFSSSSSKRKATSPAQNPIPPSHKKTPPPSNLPQPALVLQGKVAANMQPSDRKPKMKPKYLPLRNIAANKSSNTSYLQIYGTGFDTGDTVPTVLLFFDQRRFIFNAGEGLQRYCTEHKIKLSKIDHILLTRVCSETTGGLPGLLLTLAGIGETGMSAQIWGPSNLQNLVNAMRTFVPNASMLHTHSFGVQGDTGVTVQTDSSSPIVFLEDDLVKISAVFLWPHSNMNVDPKDEQKGGETLQSSIDAGLVGNLSVIYICELPEVMGKFDPKKALEKGLKPGFKYGKLQRGESVMSDDGSQMVHPSDVLDPSQPGPIMILIDCPSKAHIPALISARSLQSFFSGSDKVVNCIVHISPASVTDCMEYQEWMKKFKEAHHLMAGRQMEELGDPILTSSARILTKLNLICPHVFPITGFLSERHKKSTHEQAVSSTGETLAADNLLKFRLRPLTALGVDNSSVPESFDLIAAQEELIRDLPEISEAREYVSQVWKENGGNDAEKMNAGSEVEEFQVPPECLQCVSREEMEIAFLGTGSSHPSKYRNVSSIYVHLFERGGILLDCGEGTFAQLKRRYGAKGADNVLLSLKFIWISHIHADHHTGLPRILSERRRLTRSLSTHDPILVIGPRQLKRFLDAYSKVEDLNMEFLDCSQTTSEIKLDSELTNEVEMMEQSLENSKESIACLPLGQVAEGSTSVRDQMQNSSSRGIHFQQGLDLAGREGLKNLLSSMGLKKLVSIPVVHCLNAFGIVLESQEKLDLNKNMKPGWKLVYSGDTRPCQALVEASLGATVLIHEATFDDSMPVEAFMKNHSVTKEAIETGVSAGVYRIILTHFSQRYPKIPVFDDSYTDRTCIAFDMMSVNLADLPLLPKLLPALKMLFKDDLIEEDDSDSNV